VGEFRHNLFEESWPVRRKSHHFDTLPGAGNPRLEERIVASCGSGFHFNAQRETGTVKSFCYDIVIAGGGLLDCRLLFNAASMAPKMLPWLIEGIVLRPMFPSIWLTGQKKPFIQSRVRILF
jgi:hypothetical protein